MSHLIYNRFNAFKVLAYSERLRMIAEGKIPPPITWVVYPTNECPYNCPHCIMKLEKEEHPDKLPNDVMERKIPQDAERHGVRTVIFSGGGEPLMHPSLRKTVHGLKEAGIKVGLNTNGLLLRLVPRLSIDYLRVSVDAATPETYMKIHGLNDMGYFHILEKGLSSLKREEIGDLGLAFLVTPDNWEEIYAFCKWAQKFNPDFIHIRPAFLEADYLEGARELRRIIAEAKELGEKAMADFPNVYFGVEKFDNYWTPRIYNKCRATPLMAVLAADGAFLVCQDVFIRFGDYKKQTFRDIWWGEDHKKAIDSIRLEDCPRCVENKYNEIIEHCFLSDKLRMDLV